MNKVIRKGVRTYLIKDDKVVVIKYLQEPHRNYYDIPGGKIEDNESNTEAAIREFKEETGMDIYKPKYVGNLIVECKDIIFDFDVFIVNDYKGVPNNFLYNESMWIDIDLLLERKCFSNIQLLSKKYRYLLEIDSNFRIKFIIGENNKIIKEIIETK